MTRSRTAALLALLVAAPAGADDVLRVRDVVVDRPTLHALGVQVLIAGDDDRDARIDVRVRPRAGGPWRAGLPLLRVWPETVAIEVPEQFAGSLFDLDPGTAYEVELVAADPDGGAWRQTIAVATRPRPADEPPQARHVTVVDADALRAALERIRPGDVVELAPGLYRGPFTLPGGGVADGPVVLRGPADGSAVLDGEGCGGCDVLEVRGSYVHVEDLTILSGTRGLRFSTPGATANVARRLRIRDVVHGIGKAAEQTDFYIADNLIEGRLRWPWALADTAVAHWDDRGVDVAGDGHVIAHNRIVGFGDPVVNKKAGSRAWDVYGNDIVDAFDGVELDESTGNARLWRNRFTNVMAPVSIQPVHGGPAYVLRNVGYNLPDEQIKLKSMGGTQLPSGALIYHNTFVGSRRALNLQTPVTQYNFEILGNLFIGPASPQGGRSADWTAVVVGGRFDHDGFWPDGGFWLGTVDGRFRQWDSFAALQAAGLVEPHGVLLDRRAIFAAGFVGPDTPETRFDPERSFALDPASAAIDRGQLLPGVNTGFAGAAPDLGAVEAGCEAPFYGPRPRDQEDRIWRIDCAGAGATGVDGALDAGVRPLAARLGPSVPNPFNPVTVIPFHLPGRADVELSILDVRGRRVRTLIEGRRDPGAHRVLWDGTDAAGRRVASGVYFCRLATGGLQLAESLLLLR